MPSSRFESLSLVDAQAKLKLRREQNRIAQQRSRERRKKGLDLSSEPNRSRIRSRSRKTKDETSALSIIASDLGPTCLHSWNDKAHQPDATADAISSLLPFHPTDQAEDEWILNHSWDNMENPFGEAVDWSSRQSLTGLEGSWESSSISGTEVWKSGLDRQESATFHQQPVTTQGLRLALQVDEYNYQCQLTVQRNEAQASYLETKALWLRMYAERCARLGDTKMSGEA